MSLWYFSTRGGKETGGTAMETKEGDVFKCALDGGEYRVKRVVNRMVILESLNGKKQIMTGVDSLRINSFYEKKEDSK